ncbi:MAG TPA: DegV family protein [Bacillota bacterium]|nr:DegV family protein [Bacillota bacterium]
MAQQRVRIVTDSTADLSNPLREKYGLEMIPLNVHFGDELYKDQVDLSPEQFYEKLRTAKILPRTSQPSPGEFMELYKKIADEGAETIASIHLSAKLSGTYQSAKVAAASLPDLDIEVIDGQSASVGTAVQAIAAAEVAARGGTKEEVLAAAEAAKTKEGVYFVVDTLEYLQRNGRIGKAQAFLGTMLNVKPLLTLIDGIVCPYERVRGKKRAVGRMFEIMEEDLTKREEAGEKWDRLLVAISHADSREEAEKVAAEIQTRFDNVEMIIEYIGPVIGTHVGPGTVAVIYCPM